MPALRSLIRICLLLAFLLAPVMKGQTSPAPKRDINAVLRDVDRRLLAIPGVVGVYVGLLEDGKTECLKVMLSDSKAAAALPKSVEGYAVVPEVTGEVRPLGK
ncbi:MAG TPA: hypothetical protein VK474_03095 [Chthoniobacterales bacterium]|nr:hypothetical protein [Chthoniobacterales bacterium]